ncbi:MAG: AzlC family ABC transporter permease [Burkholderiaceae bacterium]|jgi:predicted branched-subunit amino acid permease
MSDLTPHVPGLRWHARQALFAKGLRDVLPVAPGLMAWGLTTGVALTTFGLSLPEALLMTLVVFAGSAQLAATPLIMVGAPLWVVWVTSACVALRFVVFSAHLRPYFQGLPLRQRVVCAYFMGDLSYVVFTRRYPQPGADAQARAEQHSYWFGNTCGNWLAWTSACLTGVVFANAIPSHWGLAFAGILALSAIAGSLLHNAMRVVAAAVAAGVAIMAYHLPYKLNIPLAIVAAVAVCLLVERVWPRRANTA